MRSFLVLILFLFSGSLLHAQDPVIEYARSVYRTTAGAIGPKGITATHTFELHINSSQTIILDSIIISGYHIFGRNKVIPPVPDGLVKLKLVITIHQKQTLWYNAELTFNGITVPLDVIGKERVLESDPEVILATRSGRDLHRIIKNEFDSSSSVYNK